MELSAVFALFEGLGNRGEFGIIQAAAKSPAPAGLFRSVRFNYTDQMITALEAGFEGMFDPGKYRFTRPDGWTEQALDCLLYGFRFNTGVSVTDAKPEQLERQMDSFRSMKARFMDLLHSGQKIFVYRHPTEFDETLIKRLHAAIRRHGPGRLLYVREQADRPFGWYDAAGDGLFVGAIPHLVKDASSQVNFAAWEKIARGVSVLADPSGPDADRPIAVRPVPRPPIDTPDAGIVAHYVGTGQSPFRISLPASPGKRITAKAQVFIPAEFRAAGVSLALAGLRSDATAEADMTQRDCWQPISVTAAIPADQSRAAPILNVPAEARGMIYSCGWEIAAETADAIPAPVVVTNPSPDALGYIYNNGGLNNQKLTLFGLFKAAKDQQRPVRLPDFFLHDQAAVVADREAHQRGLNPRREDRRIAFNQIYHPEPLRSFAAAEGIELIEGAADGDPGGWTYFRAGNEALAEPGPLGTPFTRGFFAALVARIRDTPAYSDIAVELARRGIGMVLQCRIEQDWLAHTGAAGPTPPQSADQVPGLMDILAKVQNTLSGDARPGIYLVNDESGLPVSKETIRKAIADRFGFSVYWKSDFVPGILARHKSFLLSMLDFELAVAAQVFVGMTMSTFSNMAAYERFVRTRRPVQDHYIYNAPGTYLERRTDNGIFPGPVQAIQRDRSSVTR
ncbi:MAG TPA: hypothetical protein VFG62_18685 [Rhodopila sp.]|nr:hypothetical protein [Rhodopila sp.]